MKGIKALLLCALLLAAHALVCAWAQSDGAGNGGQDDSNNCTANNLDQDDAEIISCITQDNYTNGECAGSRGFLTNQHHERTTTVFKFVLFLNGNYLFFLTHT